MVKEKNDHYSQRVALTKTGRKKVIHNPLCITYVVEITLTIRRVVLTF